VAVDAVIFEDAQGHVIESLPFGDGRERLLRAIAEDGETDQETDRCRRMLREEPFAVGQAAAGVGGDDHRCTRAHQHGGGEVLQDGPVRPHPGKRAQHNAGKRADPGGDPGPEVPVQQISVVAPLVGQEPARESGRKAAQRREPHHGIENDAGVAGNDGSKSGKADQLQQERQEQQRDRQVQEGRVEPSEEEEELREARAVPDLQEREGGQDDDGGDADRERKGGGGTIRRGRFGWLHERHASIRSRMEVALCLRTIGAAMDSRNPAPWQIVW
jgi:hypothetical protein